VTRYGLDTNVLIYTHMPALADHESVSGVVAGLAGRDDAMLVVSPLVLHEFVHVITDNRRFDPPVTMPEVIALSQQYLNRSNVECVDVTAVAWELALDFLVRHRLGRKRVADALLAATYLASGVNHLLTCNPADFTAFDRLVVIDPRYEQP
jgi:predicted nucleic acid-binding protein